MAWKKWFSTALICSLVAGNVSVQNSEMTVKAEKSSSDSTVESVTDLDKYENNDLIVVYKNSSMTQKKMSAKTVKIGNLEDETATDVLTDNSMVVKLDNREDLEEAIDAYANDDSVAYVQPNYVYHALEAVNIADADYQKQWGMNNDGTYTYDEDVYSGGSNSWFGGGYTKKTQTVKAKEDIDVNAPEAWSLGTGANRKAVVAIVDTGIKYDHEELADYMWNNPGEIAGNGIDDDNNGYIDDVHGWNFHAASENDFVFGGIWPGFGNGNSSDNSSDSNGNNTYYNQNSEDEDSHATHCAGVIAAKENGKGVVGIAHQQNVEIMTVKVLGGSDGSGTTESVVKGIQYAAENGANICNLSLGSAEDDQTLKSVIEDNKDMLFCVAAGNGDYNNYQGYSMDASNAIKEYPACYDFDNIITAANVQCDGNLHYTSNYGPESVDIAAPGAQIYSTSTVSGGYEYMTGTSMAAPMVSGIAALLYSYYDNVSAIDVKNMILNSARKLSSLDGKVVCGGMADAYAALQKKNTASETPIVIGTTAPNTNAPVVTPRPRPTTTAKITATPTTTAPTATAQTTTNPETTAGPSQQPQGTALPGKEPTWGYNDPYMDWWDEFWNSIFGEEPSESAGPLPTPVPITTGQPSASAVPGTTGQPSVSETPGATGQPVLPTIPSTTWEPVLPTMPSTTWKPVLPTMPGTTWEPVLPTMPGTTWEPVLPTIPSTTWEPVLPTMPGTTWKPVLPTMPSATEKPVETAEPIPTTVPTAGNTENPEPVSTPEQTIQVPTETPVVSQTPDIAVPTNTPAVSQAPASAPTNAPDGTASLGTEKEENINNKKVLLTKSKTLQMMVYHLPENVTVTWKSSDSSVVSVTQKGVVKAKAPGMAEITAKLSNGKKLTCTFIIRPAALKKVKAAQVKKKLKVCISWEKQAGVDGYRISRATSKNGKYKVLKTVNKTSTKSYMDTTVKGKTYYYKVCAYKKLSDGTKVYSVLSSACKVKVKK